MLYAVAGSISYLGIIHTGSADQAEVHDADNTYGIDATVSIY